MLSALKKLHSQTPKNEKSIFAISEHYSQVLHSYQGILRAMTKDEHIPLLNRHVDYLEQQNEWIYSLGHTKLTLSPDVVESRFIESRGEDWKSYLLQNHSTFDDAILQYLDDQERLRRYAKQSLIPSLEINTDDADWDFCAIQILEKLNQ